MRQLLLTTLAMAAGLAAATTTPPVTISASTSALRFNYSGTGTLPPAQSVQVKASRIGLSYTLTVPASGAEWLIPVSPLTGSIPANLSFRVNPSSLQAGTYNADVTIAAAGATNTLSLRVTLAIKGATPVLSVTPTPLEFEYYTAGAMPVAQKLNVTSSGQSVAVNFVQAGAAWLKLSKTAGFTVAGAPLTVDASVDSAAVSATPPGTYDGTLSVTANDSSIATVKVPVRLVVKPGLPVLSSIWPSAVPQNPGPITVTLMGSNFLKQSKVLVNGQEMAASSVTLISSTVMLVALPEAGVLNTQGTYAITVKNDAQLSAGQNFDVNPPGPYIAGIANAASYRTTTSVSPGEIICVFGSQFGLSDVVAGTITSGKYDNVIADTKVQFFNGATWVDSPLLFASPTQINAVTPFSLPAGPTKVRVVTGVGAGQQISNELDPLTVTTSNPGIFTADGTGQGQAAAVNVVTDSVTSVQTRTLNSAKNPIPKGGTLEIYLTGAGTLTGTNTDGEIVPASPLVPTSTPPTVTINGVACDTVVSVATPEAVRGLIQVNVTVPSGVTAGTSHPLVVTYGARASQTVTVAIK